MIERLRAWLLRHPVTLGVAIIAMVMLSLTLVAVWAPAGIALGGASVLAAIAPGVVQWSAKTQPAPKMRPLTDIGDT